MAMVVAAALSAPVVATEPTDCNKVTVYVTPPSAPCPPPYVHSFGEIVQCVDGPYGFENPQHNQKVKWTAESPPSWWTSCEPHGGITREECTSVYAYYHYVTYWQYEVFDGKRCDFSTSPQMCLFPDDQRTCYQVIPNPSSEPILPWVPSRMERYFAGPASACANRPEPLE